MSLTSGIANDLGNAAAKAGDDVLASATADLTQQIIPAFKAAMLDVASHKKVVVTATIQVTVEVKDKPMGPTLDPQ